MKRLYDTLIDKEFLMNKVKAKQEAARQKLGIADENGEQIKEMAYGGMIKHSTNPNLFGAGSLRDPGYGVLPTDPLGQPIVNNDGTTVQYPGVTEVSAGNNNTMDYLSAGLQGLASLTPLLAKKNNPKYQRVSAEEVPYNDRAIRAASDVAQANLKDTLKKTRMGAAGFMQNTVAGLTGIQGKTADTLANYRLTVDSENVRARNRSKELNAGIQERETEMTARERDASYMAKERAAKDFASVFANVNKDKKAEALTKEQWDFYMKMAKLMYPNAANKLGK